VTPPIADLRRDSVPSLIFSESEGTYLSCIESVPFEFVYKDELPSKESDEKQDEGD
jgi:hypothetical protein